jgi:hypothetical protein
MNGLVWGRLACAAVLGALAAAPAAAGAAPIPEGPGAGSLPTYLGSPAVPEPVTAPEAPRHPFMAPNERSNLHDDAYQTDTYRTLGPLGREMVKLDTFQELGECASITFDRQGRLVTVCVGLQGPTLAMFDPRTLDRLATFPLPARDAGTVPSIFTSFAGGGYFYLDNRDRAVIPTTSRHILVVSEAPGPSFVQDGDYDLTSAVPLGDAIISALPDWSGRLWFASTKGVVGTLDMASGAV